VLQTILLVGLGGSVLTYLGAKLWPRLREVLAVGFSVAQLVLVILGYGHWVHREYFGSFLGLGLGLRLDGLSWFFALCVTLVGALCVIFSVPYFGRKQRPDFYYFAILLVNAAMLGIVLSADLLCFFIFWEIMSWTAYLLISYKRGRALQAGLKYIVMSLIGSCSMLLGLLSVYAAWATFDIAQVASGIASASPMFLLYLLITFGIGFGIKSALVPLHTWLADAHSEAPSPFSAVLSGILIKMGVFGFILLFYVVAGLKLFVGLGSGIISFHYVLCWLAAVSIVVPTFIAVLQTDAKRLLAWSSIGQIGYIVLGLGFGTKLAFAGALLHTFNHAAFKALLFLAIAAVEYRTGGIRDLSRLGGLAKRMPVTFACALIGGLGLIGVPLTSGFVSKWLLYKTLIARQYPFLALAALIGTWGAILYVYKLIHNVFLGQLPARYEQVRSAPGAMKLAVVVLASVIIFFGVFPGLILRLLGSIGESVGFGPLEATLGGFGPEVGPLNTISILFACVVAMLLLVLILRAGARSRVVSQRDSYAAGAFVPEDSYHHSVRFYDPFERMVAGYLKDRIDQFYYGVAAQA